ncbi:hypothetical protein FKM82_000172 [Ascaphus truei]
MSILHYILGLTSVLYMLECGIYVSGKISSPNKALNRSPRETGAPSPIDCELSSWSNWSECDPCIKQKFRSRSIVTFGQYGGKRCLDSVGDTRSCKSDQICEDEKIDCKEDFECDTGRCIKRRLVCNADNDCGDLSDEICDQDPKSPCNKMEIELSEIGRTAGNGVNILGMDTRSNPFDNEYFNGLCERVRDGNTRTYYRKPWNVATLTYQTKADKSFTTETFEDSMELITRIVKESTQSFQASLSLKMTPSELNDTKITVNAGLQTSKNESLETIKEYSKKTHKTFIRVLGNVQLATFQMRSRGAMLTSTFLEDIAFLPPAYDKGEYFRFLETYGTHYTVSGNLGGKYQLVYVLDTTVMKSKEITAKDVTDCLGYNVDINLQDKDIDGKAQIKNNNCDKTGTQSSGGANSSGVIENIISFVEGGTVNFATLLDENLVKKHKEIDVEDYVKWATSLVDAPVLIKQKPSPIYTLIPVDVKDAHTKKQHLETAIEDYLDEFNVCKCRPCHNGGTVMLIDGECMCKCTVYFQGIACQSPKSELYAKPNQPIDGQWGCWSASSSCIGGERTQTRQCNNPAPQPGGTQCQGDSVKKVPC